jgi:hypothetical protein
MSENKMDLPPCALCGCSEYPVECGPRQNKLPAGCLVVFDGGQSVWICRRCSRDPMVMERLESDPTITDGSTTWSKRCPECGGLTMQVVRPGKVQCAKCG